MSFWRRRWWIKFIFRPPGHSLREVCLTQVWEALAATFACRDHLQGSHKFSYQVTLSTNYQGVVEVFPTVSHLHVNNQRLVNPHLVSHHHLVTHLIPFHPHCLEGRSPRPPHHLKCESQATIQFTGDSQVVLTMKLRIIIILLYNFREMSFYASSKGRQSSFIESQLALACSPWENSFARSET